MAKKQYFDQTFGKEEKVDRKRILAKKARKFHCDHKITEKNEEISLLKVVPKDQCPTDLPFEDERGAFKCTKCKRYLPIETKELSEIREHSRYTNSIIDVVKASIPNISDERLEQFATVQIILDQLDEMYRVHFLNNRNDNSYEDYDMDDDHVLGETYHIDTRDTRNTYDFNDNKKKNKNKKKNHKNKNNKNNKDRKGSSIFDFC